jgi:hypothetical protein
VISENGISAYYAAESGVEEGFLRYRYDRNAEVPTGDSTFFWRVGDNKVFRSNLDVLGLTNGSNQRGVPISDAISSVATNNQVYDLRMGFVGTFGRPIYGQDVVGAGVFNDVDIKNSGYADGKYDFLKIAKDETYKIDLSEIDLTDLANNDIKMMAKYLKPATDAKAIMYAKLTVDYDGTGTDIREYKTILTSAPAADTCGILGRSTDLNCQAELISASAVGISPDDIVWTKNNLISVFKSQFGAKPTNPLSKVMLSLKPLFYDAYIGLVTKRYEVTLDGTSASKKMAVPGPVTTINSTGYFGGTTRTISANIDRQSGTLYDLFDYVIYQKP